MRLLLVRAALAGVVAIQVYLFFEDPVLEPGAAFFVGLTAAIFGGTALLLVASRPARGALSSPLLLAVLLQAIVFWGLGWAILAAFPSDWSRPFASTTVLGIGLSLSIALVIVMVLHTLYAAWVTPVIAARARGEELGLGAALRGAWRRWPRAFACLTAGMAATLLLGAGLVVLIGAAGSAAPPLYILSAALLVAWNVVTAPLLLHALGADLRFVGAVRATLGSWRRGFRAWGWPVLLQLAMLGVFTFASVHWTARSTEVHRGGRTETPRGIWTHVTWEDDSHRSTVTSHAIEKHAFHAFWTGGYKDDSDWFDDVAEVYKRPAPTPLLFLAGLVLAVAAIAVKLHVAAALWPRPDEEASAVPEPPETGHPAIEGAPPALWLLALPLLLLGGCGRGALSPADLEAERERAFFEVAPGRFHVRSRSARYSMFEKTPRDRARSEALDAHLPVGDTSRGSGLRGALQYVVGSDARFQLAVADRREGLPDEPPGAPTGRAQDDPQLLRYEQDVRAGAVLLVAYAVLPREKDRTLTLVVFGGEGPPVTWPSAAEAVDGGEPLGTGYRIDVPVTPPHGPAQHDRFFGLVHGHMWAGSWLAADLDTVFPLVDWLALDARARRSSSSRTGGSSHGAIYRWEHVSEGIQIEGDGVEYVMHADGARVEDLTTWESPVWMMRGRFVAR